MIRKHCNNNDRLVSDLISKFEIRNYSGDNRKMAEFDEIYTRRRIVTEDPRIHPKEVFYDQNRDIPPHLKMRYRRSYNDSLASLNESEYFDDDPIATHQTDVRDVLTKTSRVMEFLSKLPFPRMSVTGMGIVSLLTIFIAPRTAGANILYPGFRLLFGTLYPAYASYKAVRTKNVKEYVKWMMYWIVFAFFTCIETFTDILLSWFPFYYEIKVVLVLWLLSPATRGSSTLYRKFVHPMLTRREQEIDDYINQAKEKGYTAVLQLGSKGVNYATNVIMQTAIKAFNPQEMHMKQSLQSHSRRTLSLGADTQDGFDLDFRRSNSAESALNQYNNNHNPETLQPATNSRNNILYEIESEEEEAVFLSTNTNEVNTNNCNNNNVEEQDDDFELEEGSARSRAIPKRKAATRKKATAASTKPPSTRGRKKLRKDSELDDMDVEID